MNKPFKVERENDEYTIYEWVEKTGEYIPLYTTGDRAEMERIIVRLVRELTAEERLVNSRPT